MRLRVIFVIVLLLAPVVPVPTNAQVIPPDSLDITGSIIDNYVEMKYQFSFTGGSNAAETELEFIIPVGLYLSNLSVVTNDAIFWGRVYEIKEAQETYEEAVEEEKSAALIEALGSNTYRLSVNIEKDETLLVSIYVEGFLLRQKGQYSVNFLKFEELVDLDVNVELDLSNTFSEYRSPKLINLTPSSISEITNGYHISYSHSNAAYSDNYVIKYTMVSDPNSKLMGYDNGEDQFFVYQIAPEIYSENDQLPKEYVFVLDKSGSMSGDKMVNAKDAFSTIINSLSPDDAFNVISFDASIDTLWTSTKTANSSNINTAVSWVEKLEASGGTNINDAVLSALSDLNSNNNYVKAVTLLSDGEATSGERNTNTILQNAKSNNNQDSLIFTIGLGDGSDDVLMTSLAYNSRAKFEKIGDEEIEISDKLLNFYGEFASPISSDFIISFDTAYDIYPSIDQVRNPIFNGSEVLITGKFDGSITAETTIPYITYNDTYSSSLDSVGSDNDYVERIWAINSIDRLLEAFAVNQDQEDKAKILDLALTYNLVVKDFTAIVLVVEDTLPDSLDTQIERIQDSAGAEVNLLFVTSILAMVTFFVLRRKIHE